MGRRLRTGARFIQGFPWPCRVPSSAGRLGRPSDFRRAASVRAEIPCLRHERGEGSSLPKNRGAEPRDHERLRQPFGGKAVVSRPDQTRGAVPRRRKSPSVRISPQPTAITARSPTALTSPQKSLPKQLLCARPLRRMLNHGGTTEVGDLGRTPMPSGDGPRLRHRGTSSVAPFHPMSSTIRQKGRRPTKMHCQCRGH